MDHTQHVKHVTDNTGHTFRVGQTVYLNGHEPLALRGIQVRADQTTYLVLEDRQRALLTFDVDTASETEDLRERSLS